MFGLSGFTLMTAGLSYCNILSLHLIFGGVQEADKAKWLVPGNKHVSSPSFLKVVLKLSPLKYVFYINIL